MIARLPNGNLLVSVAEYDPERQIYSDGAREVGPDDPDFDLFQRGLERYEAAFGHPLVEARGAEGHD